MRKLFAILIMLALVAMLSALAFAAPTTQPTLIVSNAAISASGTTAAFKVSVSAPATSAITVHYATLAGTASSGAGDYVGIPAGSIVIPAGQTSATVTIVVKPHMSLATAKTFSLTATAAIPVTIEATATGTATIQPATIIKADPATQPATAPATQPAGPLTINTSSITTGGSYTAITINAPLGQSVTLDHVTCDSIESNEPCDLTVTNCTISGANADYAVVAWRVRNAIIENNLAGGAGILVQDSSGNYQSATSRYNKGVEIAGPIVNGVRTKRSFIQYFKLQKGGLIMDWNETEGTRGIQAMEDAFSFCQCSGTATSRASMSNNFCGGNWDNPVITADTWKKGVHFSGSEFMVADPGGGENLTSGTNIDAIGNIGIDCENQGLVMAFGYGNNMAGNILVKDGTGSPFGSVPAQVFNWGVSAPATPAALFATNTTLGTTQYNWLVQGKPVTPIIDSKVAQSGNVQTSMTQAQARALWQLRATAAGVKIGPQ